MATSSSTLLIAGVTAKPGKATELIPALREVAEPTRAQPGCIRFDSTGWVARARPLWASNSGPLPPV